MLTPQWTKHLLEVNFEHNKINDTKVFFNKIHKWQQFCPPMHLNGSYYVFGIHDSFKISPSGDSFLKK